VISSPDYAQTLRDLLSHGRRPIVGFALGQTVTDQSISLPRELERKLQAQADEYASMYAEVANGLGSLKSIGRARIGGDGTIETTATPWEFQAWIPFASRRVLQLEGAFLSIELTVARGAVDIGILAEDGSTLLGDRYRAKTGHHQIQLTIPGNEVRGLVICNCGPEAQASAVRFDEVTLRRFDPDSPAASAWQDDLREAEAPPAKETHSLVEVPITPPLVLSYLVSAGRFHEARLLLNAAAIMTGEPRPTWWSERMDEQLTDHLRLARDIPSISTEAPKLPATEAPPDQDILLTEWEALSPVFGLQKFIPLHFEILELALQLDLLGAIRGCTVRFEWNRQGLATPLVRRGVLTNLLTVLDERLHGDLDGFGLAIHTDQSGTRVTITSGMQHGDLQYRHFSASVVRLLRAVNSQQGAAPELTHELGEENRLCLSWPHASAPFNLPHISHESAPGAIGTLYAGASGSRVMVRGAIAYKFAPAGSSKKLTVREESQVLADLADLGGTSPVIAVSEDVDGGWMSYRFRDGVPLSAELNRFATRVRRTALLQSLSDLVSQVNARSIQHRDLRSENILIDQSARVILLDFDQARMPTTDDDFGNEWDEDRACAGIGGLIKQVGWQADFLQTAGALSLAWELGRHSAANSPGKHACYYRWQWGPLSLEGERPWTTRWQVLSAIFAGSSGRFLELGSNLGMLATYAALHGWNAHGLERDGVAVAAARIIAGSLGSAATFSEADLTSAETWGNLDQTYDLVSALSVVHWLPDPSLVEAFLARQPKLLFEGHRSAAEESDYLRKLGFTSVDLLGYSERLRPILLAHKPN